MNLIKLSNTFVFPDPEHRMIKIQQVSSGIYGHFSLYSLLFSFVTSSKLNIFVMYNNDSSEES